MFIKFLRSLGYKVFYLENITDIDDKIINRAHKERTTPSRISRKFTKAFLEDMRSLGIRSITRYAPASAFISEIIRQVERLIRKGSAYVAKDGSVYFRVSRFKDYGKLSRQKLHKLKQFESGEYKKDPRDFALWKASKPGEPKWKSPWGWGRPGWHIEDTAISEKYFGPQYDVHGGGIDLIFPHHECEIAQQEVASGRKPFVRYWMHAGLLKVGGTKMSKSLGNFITIRTMLKVTKPEILRLMVTLTHYRSPLDYTDKLLEQTKASQARLQEFITKISSASSGVDNVGIASALNSAKRGFYASLRDDFNTPKALAYIFQLVSKLNPRVESIGNRDRKKILQFIKQVDDILGIVGKIEKVKIPSRLKKLASRREDLRKQKRWQEADKIRAEIKKLGWIIEDTPTGPRLKKI